MSLDKTTYLHSASDNLLKLYDDLTQYALNDIVERMLENNVITGTAEYRIWRLQQLGLHLDKIKTYIAKMTGKSNKEIERIFKEYGLKYYKSVRNISVKFGQDMDYVPAQQMGAGLSNSVQIENDDEIVWNTPYARFLYMGKLMLDERGSSWAKPNTKKHIVDKDSTYSKEAHSKAGSHWFERAMEDHKSDWIDTVKKAVK